MLTGTRSSVIDSAGNQISYRCADRGRLEAVVIAGLGPPTGAVSTRGTPHRFGVEVK